MIEGERGGVSGGLYWGYYMDSFISIGQDVLEGDHVSDIWRRDQLSSGYFLGDGRKQKKRDELKRTRVLYSLNEDFY